jgi:hypothetical protein
LGDQLEHLADVGIRLILLKQDMSLSEVGFRLEFVPPMDLFE